MKKYIAIAALLAAETAFANAAAVSLYDYSSATDKNMANNGWTVSGSTADAGDAWRIIGGIVPSGSTKGVAGFAHKDISNTGLFDEDEFSVTFKLSFSADRFNADGTVHTSDYGKTNGNLITLMVGDGTDVYLAQFGYNVSDNAFRVAGGISTNFATGGTSCGFSFGTFADVTVTVDTALDTATLSVGTTTINLSKADNNSSIQSSYHNKVLVGTLSGGTIANVSVASVTAIPEPSAFGLLAGAGALALVAARRRRAK